MIEVITGGVVALILKVVYDKWFSKSSRVTMELFTANNKLIDQRFEKMVDAINANNLQVDQKFLKIIETCKGNQATCSGKIIARMDLNSALIEKQLCDYTVRLDEGDDSFKSNRHVTRAVLLTLLDMCKHMGVDCDSLTKTFVDQDILL